MCSRSTSCSPTWATSNRPGRTAPRHAASRPYHRRVRNIESKFRCSDHERIASRAISLGARDAGFLYQHDQFFGVPRGRLKLRTFRDGQIELISYDRDDIPEARASEYSTHCTGDPGTLEEVLTRALARTGTVEKTRHLLICRMTRIHLDDVVGLGRFVELETVIKDQTEIDAAGEHDDVVSALGLADAERISVGYVDLPRERSELIGS
jgi:adenylate cyclase class IV